MSRRVVTPARWLGLVMCALCACAAMSATGAAASGAPAVTANVLITHHERNPVRENAIPSVLVDRTDERRVFLSEVDLLSSTCRLHVSTDGGASFAVAKGNPLPAGFDRCFPNSAARAAPMVWAGDGAIVMALEGENPGDNVFTGPGSVIVSRSTDSGQTWQSTIVRDNRHRPVQQSSFGPYTEGAWQIHLASDPARHQVVVAWMRRGIKMPGINQGDPVMRPYVAISNDDGRTFAAPVDVGGTDPASLGTLLDFWRGNSVAIGSDGTIFDLYNSSPKGLTAPLTPYLDISTSGNGGTRFSVFPVEARTPFTDWPEIATGPLPGGRGSVLIAVFEDLDPSLSGAQRVQHIYARRSLDSGRTWSALMRLDDDPLSGGYSQYMPDVSIAPDGRVDAAWYDFRNDNGSFLSDVYYTYSNDGGASWAPNIRISEHSSNRHFGGFDSNGDVRGPVGLASTDRAAYLAWDDTRRARSVSAEPVQPFSPPSDVYFSAAQFEPLPPPNSALPIAASALTGFGVAGLLLLAFAVVRARR